MNIQIRLMSDNEAEHVNAVYNNTYGNIRPKDYFEWEFLNGPWGKAIYVLAVDLDKNENNIVGTQCAIPIIFIDGNGNKILTAKSEDTFVHPDYRGHKLFDKMYEMLFSECKKAGIKYIWGFTYARKPFLKLGFEIPFDSLQGVFITNPIKAFKYLVSLNVSNTYIDKFKILGLCFLSKIKIILNGFFNFGKKFNIDHSKHTSKKTLISSVLKTNRNFWTIDQTEEYISWRITNNPYPNNFKDYSALTNNENSCSANFLFNIHIRDVAYIEEILFDSSIQINEKVALMTNVIKEVRNSVHPSLFRFWGFQTNEINSQEIFILNKAGFTFVKKGTAFVWKDLNENDEKLIKPENILISRLFTQGNR